VVSEGNASKGRVHARTTFTKPRPVRSGLVAVAAVASYCSTYEIVLGGVGMHDEHDRASAPTYGRAWSSVVE
jgi:hypothetical protein